MAIQMRRGVYAKLDKKRLVPGEFAVVQSGDPDSSNGMGAYVCFSANNTKKLMTQEDITTELINSEKDAAKQITDNATAYVKSAEAARVSAENTRVANENARKSAESTRVSNENTRISNENARKTAESARETAQAKNNSDQEKNNKLAKNGVAYVILTSSQVNSSTGVPTITGTKGTMYFAPTNDTADSDKTYVEWVYPNGAWERVSPRFDSGDGMVDANRNDAATVGTKASSGSSASVGVDNVPISFEGLANALVAFKTGITSLFAAKSHTHAASDITTGALPVANGGTGQTTVAAARNVLGLGNTTGALPVANGGTGSTTASAARAALGAQKSLSVNTLATGTTTILGATYKVTAVAWGAIVQIEATAQSGNISSGGATSTMSGVVITIPSGYRPSVPTSASFMVMEPVTDIYAGKAIGFVIFADGTVRLICNSRVAMNAYGADSFSITYIVH